MSSVKGMFQNGVAHPLEPVGEEHEGQGVIITFVDEKRNRPRRKPRFGWAGALRDMHDEFTSVDLQHEITRLRGEAE